MLAGLDCRETSYDATLSSAPIPMFSSINLTFSPEPLWFLWITVGSIGVVLLLQILGLLSLPPSSLLLLLLQISHANVQESDLAADLDEILIPYFIQKLKTKAWFRI